MTRSSEQKTGPIPFGAGLDVGPYGLTVVFRERVERTPRYDNARSPSARRCGFCFRRHGLLVKNLPSCVGTLENIRLALPRFTQCGK